MNMDEHKIEAQSQPGAVSPPVCAFCAHWTPERGRHCSAFPVMLIPAQVWDGFSFHFTPVGGEQRDTDGKPIVFKLHPEVKLAAIQEANPALAKALRSGWARQ